MQVHRDLDSLPLFTKAVITIGTFDGVHLGHRQIIDNLLSEAATIGGETVIITFHPHPRKIVSTSGNKIHLINTLDEKILLLENLGIDHLVVVPFTDEFANQEAADYVSQFLVERFSPHTIIIGYDHRFGKERKGNYLLLEQLSTIYKYKLQEIPKHVLDEIAISSTIIRKSLLTGKSDIAERLLGYQFFFSGKVVDGDKLGRELGYPTANLEIDDDEKLTPGNGIYAVYVDLITSVQTVERLKGMMSIGVRPTVGGKKRKIEVNIFDFNKDIYGQLLRVHLKKYLREELKFDSLEALTKQIDQDKIDSIAIL